MSTPDSTRPQGSLVSYSLGFALSLGLTLIAYVLATRHMLGGNGLLVALAVLAISQLLVQLFFFLHLGHDSQPRWKQLVFVFMLIVVGILVVGSLWIMKHLNYHMMEPQKIDQQIIEDEGY